MERKTKRPGRTRQERLHADYRQELFRQALAHGMLRDGEPPKEVWRRLGATPEEIDRRVLELREALG